jgi:prepilin-type N-terminal cleavage/methylation domain-containing protein
MRRETKRRQNGFSLIEVLLVVAILSVVLAVVFTQLANMQKKYRTEETKVDMTQVTREMLDEVARDLHQSGFPSSRVYTIAPADTASNFAVGLVKVTPTQVWFEGDVDQDGSVDVVRYDLYAPGGSCPCQIRRSIISPKANGTAPQSQTFQYTPVILDNVVNSGGLYTISGTTAVMNATGSATTAQSNDSLYASLKGIKVFQAFDATGTEQCTASSTGCTYPTDKDKLNAITNIKITVSVLGQPGTGANMRPAVSATANAKVINTYH